MQRSLDQAGSRFQSIGSKLTAGISLPLAGAGLVITKFASDFETSTTKLVTLSGVSEQQMKKMRQAVLDLAPTVGIGPRALADALLVVTSTGFEGAQAMEILAVAAKSSAVGMGDTKDIARALTAAISAYGAENLTAAQAGDILFSTVVQGGAEATELAGAIGTVIPIAAQLGVSFAEVGAFIATYTRLGVNADEATTGLRGALTSILNPSAEAVKALQGIGLSADDLRAKVAQEGLGQTLIGVLDQLKNSGGAEAIGAVFGNVRALAGVLGTAGSQMEGYRSNIYAITHSTGGLNAAFAETKKTAGQQWNEAKAGAEAAAIVLGTQLLPAVTSLLQAAKPLGDWVVKAIQWFTVLPQPVQTTVFAVLGLLAALGPVAYAIGTLLRAGGGILSLVQMIGGLGGAAGAMQVAWTTAISVFEVVASVVGGLVTVFGGWAVLLGGALIAGVVALGLKTGALQAVFSGLWDVLKGTVTLFMDLATIVGVGVYEAVSAVWTWLSNLSIWGTLADGIRSVGRALADMIPDWVKTSVGWIVGKFQAWTGYAHDLAGAMRDNSNAPPKTPNAPNLPGFAGGITAPVIPADVLNWGAPKATSPGTTRSKEEIAAAKRAAEAWKKVNDEITGTAAIASAGDWMKHLTDVGGLTKITTEATRQLHGVLDEAIAAYALQGRVAPKAMLETWAATLMAVKVTNGLDPSMMGEALKLPTVPEIAIPNLPKVQDGGIFGDILANPTVPAMKTVGPFREAFGQLGKDLPNIIFGALQNGGSVLGSIAAGIGAQFGKQFQSALAAAGGDFSKLSTGNKLLGVGSSAIGAAFTGYDLGAKLGKGKGALAGAASGALAGSVAGPVGSLIGAGVGALAGFFGGRKKDKEAAAQMTQQREEILKQYGGMEKLTALADSLHVSLGNAFSTKKPEEFRAAIDKLNTAIEAQKVKMEGLGEIVSGVNARGTAFADSLKAGGAKPGSEDEFNRVGAMALGGLGAGMAGGAGLLATLTQMKPVLDALNQSQAQFNFNGSEAVQRLLEMNAAVNANLPSFQALDADGQILNGMLKANWADMGLFAATSTDVAAKIAEITAGGMPMSQALGLNQPVLQSLWEAQQKFGFSTDEATQALLNQAVTQGIVGPQMKAPMDKLLDVMMAIGKVLGADLPAYLSQLPGAAAGAADGMNDAFSKVEIPGGHGWGDYNPNYQDPNSPNYVPPDGGAVSNPDIPALAGGGLVNGRTLAWIGESGPELVIPASDFASILGAAVSPLSGGMAGAFGLGLSDARLAKIAAHSQQGGPDVVVPQVDMPGSGSSSANDRPNASGWRDRFQTGVAGGNSTIVFEQDGRQTAQYLLPYIADETTRLRLNG